MNASVLFSVVMVLASSLMSVPMYTGTRLQVFVDFNKPTMDDILVCMDNREGSYRWGVFHLMILKVNNIAYVDHPFIEIKKISLNNT